MSHSHLQTTTGQPAAAGAAGSNRFDRPQRREPTATAGCWWRRQGHGLCPALLRMTTERTRMRLDWIEQGLTSPPTQYWLSGRQFYRSKDPTNSIKVLKEKHVWDVELGELLTLTQPHSLSFGRVKSKPTGSQPCLDIGQTRGETVDGWSGIIDRRVSVNLDVVNILVHLETTSSNDLSQFSRV